MQVFLSRDGHRQEAYDMLWGSFDSVLLSNPSAEMRRCSFFEQNDIQTSPHDQCADENDAVAVASIDSMSMVGQAPQSAS